MCVVTRVRVLILLAMVLIHDEPLGTNMCSFAGGAGLGAEGMSVKVEWSADSLHQFLLFRIGHLCHCSSGSRGGRLAPPLMYKVAAAGGCRRIVPVSRQNGHLQPRLQHRALLSLQYLRGRRTGCV